MERKYTKGHPKSKTGHTNRTDFGNAIKILRIRHNETLAQMAKAIGYSSGLISELETGKRTLTLDFIARCLKHYKADKETAIDILAKAFQSSPKIIINTEYFKNYDKLRKPFEEMCISFFLGRLLAVNFGVRESDYTEEQKEAVKFESHFISDITQYFEKVTKLVRWDGGAINIPDMEDIERN
jgi:transcriptional regulator with XRE-family HTH domain